MNRARHIVYLAFGESRGSFLGRTFRASDPNIELAKAAREAIGMAADARRDAEIARKTSSALRIVALVIGTTAPLVVAYLVYRLQSRQEAGVREMLQVLEHEKLIDLGRDQRTKLPPPRYRLLKEHRKEEGNETGP